MPMLLLLPSPDKNFAAAEGMNDGDGYRVHGEGVCFDRVKGDEVSIHRGGGTQSLHSWIACSAI